MTEEATRLAALRSGKLDLVGIPGISQIKSIDQAESLRKTSPDLKQWPFFLRSETIYYMNVNNPHFSDKRVRIALQKALPLEEINNGYFKGQGNWIPHGMVGDSLKGYYIPYEQWPKALQEEFAYDPQEAERLLDEAGYPRGADGIRFKTHVLHYEVQDIAYPELVTEYWRRIGVEAQIWTPPFTEAIALASQMKFEAIRNGEGGHHYFGEHLVTRFWGGAKVWNVIVAKDPEFDKMIDALRAANDLETYQKIFREADMYAIKKHWFIWGPDAPHFHVSQPWLKGYNGEIWFGFVNRNPLLAHLWVDQELKKEMGF
jgi:peptide/nickel transport system substrate-binding protein